MNASNSDLLRYLIELRQRLLHCVLLLAIVFLSLFYFANHLYTLLALPLLKQLPHGQGLIATNVVAPFFVPFDLTFIAALFISIPFFLYQIWAFVAPALYLNERKAIWPLLFISIILFYSGVAFAYYIFFPLLFGFIAHSAPQGVLMSPDISQYLDFTLKLFLVFGVAFEIPVITVLCVRSGVTTREKLIRARPYVIVGAFVMGMLLAPPDILSQTMLAVPLWLLFETGIVLSRFLGK